MSTNLSAPALADTLKAIRKAQTVEEVMAIRLESHNYEVNDACAFKCETLADRSGWCRGDMRTFALKKRLKIAPIPVATWFEVNTGKTHGGIFEPNRNVRLFVNRKYDCGRGCELIFHYVEDIIHYTQQHV